MRFGLFYEHQLPRPWSEDSELTLLHQAVEQCELADRLGYGTVWEVEHHFLEEYSHSSAPEVFLAYVAARTQHIRLGHGIVLTAPGFNHPIRTAERLATLDLLSRGRVEFGSGESSSQAELGGFGVAYDDKRARWEEGLRITLRAMMESPFRGHGGGSATLDIPVRNVVPKPWQKPHPPLWLACSRRDTMLMAAARGMGALTFAFVDPDEARQWVDDYHAARRDHGDPIGATINAKVACVVPFMCAATEEAAVDRGLEGADFFAYSLAHYYLFGRHVPAHTSVWDDFLARRVWPARRPRGAIGTADQLRELCRAYEAAGVDELIFVAQVGRNRHEDVCEAIERFGREVLPEFAARHIDRPVEPVEPVEPPSRGAPTVGRVSAETVDGGETVDGAETVIVAVPRALAELVDSVDGHAFLDGVADRRANGDDTPAIPGQLG